MEALWSVTDENSDIYKINHREGGPVLVTDETAEIVSFTLEMAKETEVALSGNTICLNPGMMLDLDAVGKGYASDEVAEIL